MEQYFLYLILISIITVPKDQKEFSGKVTEVVNGETIIVKVGQVYKRITLSSIRQPRPVEGQDAGVSYYLGILSGYDLSLDV